MTASTRHARIRDLALAGALVLAAGLGCAAASPPEQGTPTADALTAADGASLDVRGAAAPNGSTGPFQPGGFPDPAEPRDAADGGNDGGLDAAQAADAQAAPLDGAAAETTNPSPDGSAPPQPSDAGTPGDVAEFDVAAMSETVALAPDAGIAAPVDAQAVDTTPSDAVLAKGDVGAGPDAAKPDAATPVVLDAGGADAGAPADVAKVDSAPPAVPDAAVDTAQADTAPDAPVDTGSPADVAPADTAPPIGLDAAGDAAADTTVPPDSAPTDSAPTDKPVRFIALGDGGRGDSAQAAVAKAMAAKCNLSGCDFVLMLGDNIQPTGAETVDDAQFKTKFEIPYAALDMPFYAALGNHDYGADGDGTQYWKGPVYVDYAKKNPKWVMPHTHFDFIHKNIRFFALDSNMLYHGKGAEQFSYFGPRIAEPFDGWKIAFAHHPYVSNGPHGNAKTNVRTAYDKLVCGQVDLLMTGHDHSLQWLKQNAACPGVEFIVSGAGSVPTGVSGSNPTWFEAGVSGFLWVEVQGNLLHAEFIDKAGKVLFSRDITKQ